jgi:hypothetical protein
MVHGLTGDEVEDVARTLRFFEPLRVDVIRKSPVQSLISSGKEVPNFHEYSWLGKLYQ